MSNTIPLYQKQLIREIREKRLWKNEYWLLLGYYQENWLGTSYESLVQSKDYFLSNQGKNDPQAELEATLKAFFSETLLLPRMQTAQCAFPARYRWLKQQLAFDPKLLPEHHCEQYEAWWNSIAPTKINFIFAAYSFDDPGTIFGHTFFRIYSDNKDEQGKEQSFSLNYAAQAKPTNLLTYAFKGVFGGYEGVFTINPFEYKYEQYTHVDDRDIWEYALDLNAQEITMLMKHLWEMNQASIDYYFLRENCSFMPLRFLEIAKPELELTKDIVFWTLPPNTVRLLVEKHAVVGSPTYYPSRSTRIRQQLALLSEEEQGLVWAILETPNRIGDPEFLSLQPSKKAMIVDLAVDIRIFKIERSEEPLEEKKLLDPLLLARSKLNEHMVPIKSAPLSKPPEKGHRSAFFKFGTGASKSYGRFAETGGQFLLHDLLSRDAGYLPLSQINFFSFRIRYEETTQQTTIEEFNPIDVIALFPLTNLNTKPSWKARFGWERLYEEECDYCTPFLVQFGLGLAAKNEELFDNMFYFMLEPTVRFGNMFENGYRTEIAVDFGAIFDIVEDWRIQASAKYSTIVGKKEIIELYALKQRISITRNLEIRVDFLLAGKEQAGYFGVGYYF